MVINPDAHWRDTARTIRFFIWDGNAAFPIVIFLMHITLWTFILAATLIAFFSLLNRYGFTPLVFWRWLRNMLAGSHKMAIPWWMS